MSAARMIVVSEEDLSSLVEKAVKSALGAHGGGPLLVDKQALAQKLGCSAGHIDNLRKQGLPVVKVGEAVRFEPGAVLDWLRQRQSNDPE